MKLSIVIQWSDMQNILKEYFEKEYSLMGEVQKVKLMRKNYGEEDSEIYEAPEYVMVDFNKEEDDDDDY